MLKYFQYLVKLIPVIVIISLVLSLTLILSASSSQYKNPLIQQRADPHIYKHTDGYYYFTASVPEYDRIVLRRATTIKGLANAPETTIWTKHSTGEMGANIWAPEIHFINGKWYIYFAAGSTTNIWAIRMYVIESDSTNPIDGTWTEKGQIQPSQDAFSLDATTFEHNGTRYLVFAKADSTVNNESCVFIASMSNPWTLSSTPVRITKPEYSWERAGIAVNEGPAVLKKNGKIYISYSAANTGSNYCMGMLTATDTSNLLSASSWSKASSPIMKSSDITSQYGPGHNSFVKSEDGSEDIIVYHARPYKDITGDPLYDPNRHTRTQKIYWNNDGTPNFGIPVADGSTPFRYKSYNFPTYYINHYDYIGNINVTKAGLLPDSQFNKVTGIADSKAISLESINFPGYFLRNKDGKIMLEKNDNSTSFKADATFYQRNGLADSNAISFESYNNSGQYIRHYDYKLIVKSVSTEQEKADATFIED